jgi:hypothetical protein
MILVLVVVAPSILLWIFGVPILIAIVLYRNQKIIGSIGSAKELSKLDQH